ncbi:hypothetical protein FLAG1_07770 [Fusarium langsethiae]|uniref:Uncharacterized protein n=1 Tax=Fusarium langsethiae TaxID=179993 RepID=A0A0N0DD98_FUSLA|nr:hypothetical protein FLAG1_07770 [Fusarium langsethiae]GKU04975.1 unnamed protein product [Fusarium langsethiae]GKU20467.1 unnamed protein product [Fusarium langsethiae]
MCVETITIALCAPESSPHLSFTCGKLHLVAGRRTVCDKASGRCVCYFGTCGNAGRAALTDGIDFSAISKVRCTSCTAREDAVGDRRKNQEVLESVLLDPSAVHYVDVDRKVKLLSQLWHQKSDCPYHAEGPVIDSASAEASFDEVSIEKQGPVQSATTDVFEHNEADSASAVDAWTSAPVSVNTDITEIADFDSPSDKDHASIVGDGNDDVTTGFINDGDASVKAGSDTDKGVQNGLEGGTTLVTRRAVNFSYSAEAADKLRDATSKFASLKSGFLMGKAT